MVGEYNGEDRDIGWLALQRIINVDERREEPIPFVDPGNSSAHLLDTDQKSLRCAE
jgi:hypothetical protein